MIFKLLGSVIQLILFIKVDCMYGKYSCVVYVVPLYYVSTTHLQVYFMIEKFEKSCRSIELTITDSIGVLYIKKKIVMIKSVLKSYVFIFTMRPWLNYHKIV